MRVQFRRTVCGDKLFDFGIVFGKIAALCRIEPAACKCKHLPFAADRTEFGLCAACKGSQNGGVLRRISAPVIRRAGGIQGLPALHEKARLSRNTLNGNGAKHHSRNQGKDYGKCKRMSFQIIGTDRTVHIDSCSAKQIPRN